MTPKHKMVAGLAAEYGMKIVTGTWWSKSVLMKTVSIVYNDRGDVEVLMKGNDRYMHDLEFVLPAYLVNKANVKAVMDRYGVTI